MKKIVVLLMLSAVGLCLPADAQNGEIVVKGLEGALSRQLLRQASRGMVEYHPVFGYMSLQCRIPFSTQTLVATPVWEAELCAAHTAFSTYKRSSVLEGVSASDLPIQVAPVLQQSERVVENSPAFVPLEEMTTVQVTQACYLWRLANPSKPLSSNPTLYQAAQDAIESITQITADKYPYSKLYDLQANEVEELPSVRFLQRLMNGSFEPSSYADLAQKTTQYPQHIKLNRAGFPEPTAEAEQAKILDNYLLLSNPRAMGAYNNVDEMSLRSQSYYYHGFVLTRAEKQAAKQLVDLREKADRIPSNPTARELLQLAYNRLASHQVQLEDVPQESLIDVFPKYANVENYPLRQAIKAKIEAYEKSSYAQEYDMEHLIVLDAVMGGLAGELNFQKINRALDAWEYVRDRGVQLSPAEIQPGIARLDRGLRTAPVIWEFIDGHPWGYLDKPEDLIEEELAELSNALIERCQRLFPKN